VLFQYEESRKVLDLHQNEDVAVKVKECFSLDSEARIIFQKYEEDWGEWVDVTVQNIEHKDKIQVHVLQSKPPPNVSQPTSVDQPKDSLHTTRNEKGSVKGNCSGSGSKQTTLLMKDGAVSIGPALEVGTMQLKFGFPTKIFISPPWVVMEISRSRVGPRGPLEVQRMYTLIWYHLQKQNIS
ncbi:unnamed protein product, partial [Porites lobata]